MIRIHQTWDDDLQSKVYVYRLSGAVRATNCFLLIAALTPIALVYWYVVTQGRLVPVGDNWWDPVYIAVKTQTRTLTFEDLFAMSWGHRPVITRLITALATITTHYNAGLLRFAAFVLTLLNLGLTLLLLRFKQILLPLSFCLFATVLFTLYYPPNWLDMCYSAWQQALFFMLLGLLVLQRIRPGWTAFLLLVLCATAASCAYASGLAAWISLPIAAAGIVEYRRRSYVMLWLLASALFIVFYASDYAVPSWSEENTPSLSLALSRGIIWPLVFLFEFLSVRFNPSHMTAMFALVSFLVLVMNWWRITHTKDGGAIAALWGSMAVYAIGAAVLVLFARGEVNRRYGPGSDGFWLAFIGLSLLVLAQRPRPYVAVLNISLLLALVAWSVRADVRAIRSLSEVNANRKCDKSIVNFPLYRDNFFHTCFIWSEDQSVYQLAALRLSVFHDETPRLILPRTDAPVITDTPNRWLSVYVRDYMMAGLPRQNIYSIAPVPGAGLVREETYRSPYSIGEWSTDILPEPLRQTWKNVTELASDLPILTRNHPLLWYLNVPETEANFSTIEHALAELGYAGTKFPIRDPRYVVARFDLWCFEQRQSGACAASTRPSKE